MGKPLTRAIQFIGMGLSLALLAPFVQPSSAFAAAPQLSLSKSVAVGTSSFHSTQNAIPGSTLTYQLTYANTGNANATPLTVTDILAQGQTVTSASAGCTSSVISGGYTQITCTVSNVPTYPTLGYSGVLYIQTIVNSGFSGTITNVARASAVAANTAISNSTVVTVGTPPPPNSAFSLQKSVAVNGNTYITSATANTGDTLTYLLRFTNSTGTTLNSVTLSDTLAAGQAFITPPNTNSACANYNSTTRTVSCTFLNVPAGSFTVYIQTGVQNGAPTITNQATATTNNMTAFSNPTYVTVGQPTQYFTGSFTICGVLTGYLPAYATTGSMSFFGKTFTVSPGMTATGQPFSVGLNACYTFTTNTFGQIVSVNVTPNLTGVNVVCGVYTVSTTIYTINLSGHPFGFNGTFVPFLTTGGYFCFVVDNTGTAYILLSNIPTSIAAAHLHQSGVLAATRQRAL